VYVYHHLAVHLIFLHTHCMFWCVFRCRRS